MSKYTDFIHNSPVNAQSQMILDSVKRSYENGDLIGSERSSITGLHDLMLSNIDSLAARLSGATTDLMETMLGISILEFCDFNTKMGIFMNRLMQININERRITLNSLGADAVDYGNSDNITAQALRPTYAEGMNYIDFVKKVHSSEPAGVLSTQQSPYISSAQKTISPTKFDYGNLYPDDLSQGDNKYFRTRRWRYNEDQNSLLFKTKSLFERNKINTLISRFGTKTDSKSNSIIYNGSKKTVYGESHGRNLLKADMEKPFGGGQYMLNGYNNPYCRVWTHHYQYNQFYKTIRPFSSVGYDANTGEEIVDEADTLTWFHRWPDFGYERDTSDKTKDYGYGWKSYENDWDKSVLNLDKGGDGMIKITPKYVNSRETNIHTKDCMFSIENLAWRGYDPYSFEKALSWEQRGPLGGRIMWFPPYGITFNETTNVNWSSNTFIGRGEDVYTYVNTVRSGTLSFLMVVDHPSIIDYISWYDEDNNGLDEYTDTDLMRFFAGCDSLDPTDPRSIMSRVRPTPLTDEYIDTRADTPDTVKEATPPVPPPPPEIPKETKRVSFYVFFPNNYSGYYDDSDFAVAYLLAGAGCQKNGAEDMKMMEGSDGSTHEFSFPNLNIEFFGGTHNTKYTNPGYETTGNPVSNCIVVDGGINIIGAEEMMEDLDAKNNFIYGFALPYSKIVKTEKKRWYYRVDGKYASATNSETRNTYGQKIIDLSGGLSITPENTNYCDEVSYLLNSEMTNWDESFRADEQEDSTDVIYCTFADIAQVVAKQKGYKNAEEFCKDRSSYGDIIANQIDTIFKNYKLVGVDAVGYSNIHGVNADEKVNETRNDNLANARCNTIINWLTKNEIIPEGITPTQSFVSGHEIEGENKLDHSSLGAKLWRSAKITLIFETDETKELAKMSQAADEEQNTTKFEKYAKYTETDIPGQYKDMEGRTWTERTLDDGSHELVLDEAYRQLTTTDDMRGASQLGTLKQSMYNDTKDNGFYSEEYRKYGMPRQTINGGDKNRLRYDQEYYFFRALKKKDPLVFDKLMDKIKYFDPAFHSMTPEGFNARLTFLNQCTRQGNTITMSDMTGMTANNLAFGRPPFCVLRIGDFYNQLIVIDNINIDYDVSNGIQWDMNTEGIGMQPLLARVNISFKFIGGSDIAGPIRRLQNAMTFNYYANTRFYDNRADRMYYQSERNSKEVGGGNNHGVDLSNPRNYAYITEQYKEKK